MIFPYPHSAALAQVPVPYLFKGEEFLVYPLRLRDGLSLDMFLRGLYVRNYGEKAKLIPEGDRSSFISDLGKTLSGISYQRGVGHSVLWGSPVAMTHLVYLLVRGVVSEERIRELFFSRGLDRESLTAVSEMFNAVICPTPSVPKLNIPPKKPKYEHTLLEREARVYHTLAKEFHWTYEQVLDLTEYQIFWYLYLYPDEREHHEEIHAMAHRGGEEGEPSVTSSGLLHFNSPEEYEAWKAKQSMKGI